MPRVMDDRDGEREGELGAISMMMIMIFICSLTRVNFFSSYRVKITMIRVQILDETDCISHSTNTLGKGMNPIIFPPAMGK